mmetsp:Transcript_126804/g.370703  ORF Transcript_126804/g.370703 Transcript_126804/m.370703 type:complete len:809 (+) Transcript_126804:82-2508(+)
MFRLSLLLLAAPCLASARASPSKDGPSAVGDLLDRVLPGARQHFALRLASACPGLGGRTPCYHLADEGDHLAIVATGASELAAAVGFYLRDYCNMTIGWPRGGGSNVFLPRVWPKIGTAVTRSRSVPWSYMMNVCTHSYSLVWYDWEDWQRFIDWMALSGINNVLALTGQEEVQYKVFRELGLNDTEVRGWFNGPAFLTWSRGQNEYGAGIAGPLPRSWMKAQWALQQKILARYRELGIVGQLPGFQGNVPVALKAVLADANITVAGATGWMDSLDPLYGEVADLWMRTLIQDFGTDHWYQLDGYLNGGTAPWLSRRGRQPAFAPKQDPASGDVDEPLLPETGDVPADPEWVARGAAAFQGLNRTDPDAVWSYQGFAFEFWKTTQQASWLKGFVSAVPPGRFNVVDMDYTSGEWRKFSKWWDGGPAFFGANFFWTALHNFGGTDGLKGNISRVSEMPFSALDAHSNIWGTGFTAEGIDQNPAFYDILIEQAWRTRPLPDIPAALAARAHRHYGLTTEVPEVAAAWHLLSESMYAQDVSVQDDTGVAHLPGTAAWDFARNRRSPSSDLCKTFHAWSKLVVIAPSLDVVHEPFRYDLVNLGRDVLARLSTPVSMNFSDSVFTKVPPDPANVTATGHLYLDLLNDIDALVGTDSAFLLGPWLAMARRFGEDESDCAVEGMPEVTSCEQFYEWNARVQITTWNPTARGAAQIPGGPIDYAAKHWNGLIGGYYKERAARILALALASSAAKRPVSQAAVDRAKAALAFEWTTAFGVRYPEQPTGDAVAVSQRLLAKYAPYFVDCDPGAQAVYV